MRVLVVQFKIVSAEYFLDEMQDYEVFVLYDMLPYSDFSIKEMSRIICYIQAQTHSKSKLTPEKIISFPWDSNKNEGTEVSEKDVSRMKIASEKIYAALQKHLTTEVTEKDVIMQKV